ncbi:MAG: twin-arginine translocase TatA/TatE family subunit [Thermoanaerobaculia bacterium]
MFGPLGFPEMIFIVVLALLIFGPKRLPEVGRTIGKGMAQFRRATSDLRRTIEEEIDLEGERERKAAGPRRASLALRAGPAEPSTPAAGAGPVEQAPPDSGS